MRFALDNAEVVFAIQPHLQGALKFMSQIRSVAASLDRTPPKVLLGIQPIIGATEAEARSRMEVLKSAVPFEANLARLSGLFGIDLSSVDPDLAARSGQHGSVEGVARCDIGFGRRAYAFAAGSGLAMGHLRWHTAVGRNADANRRHDGALVAGDRVPRLQHKSHDKPGQRVEFRVGRLFPILQQRGLFRTEYSHVDVPGHIARAVNHSVGVKTRRKRGCNVRKTFYGLAFCLAMGGGARAAQPLDIGEVESLTGPVATAGIPPPAG